MITAKALRIKGLPPLARPENSTAFERTMEEPITNLSRTLDESSTGDSLELPQSLTRVVKTHKEIILDSLSIFPETGLSGRDIYGFIKSYFHKEDLKIPERDVIFANLARMTERGILERVKRDNVYWYKLCQDHK